MKTSKSSSNSVSTRGFSLLELLIVVAIILIIAAIAVPNLLRARIAANEAAAASSVRAVTSAAVVYSTTWDNGLPPNLGVLGGASVTASCDLANLLDPSLTVAPFEKSGYKFDYKGFGPTVIPGSGCAQPGYNEYLATATPMAVGYSGEKSFCSDQPGVIHYDPAGIKATTPAQCALLPTL